MSADPKGTGAAAKDRPRMLLAIYAGVFVTAVLVAAGAVMFLGGWTRPILDSDGHFFIRIAHALASGQGYVLDSSPWPQAPELGRLPLWPAILAIPAWLFPGADEFLILRAAGVAVHALGTVLMAVATMRLYGRPLAALLAGLLFAVSPSALSFIDFGLSEPAWALCALAAFVLLVRNPASLPAAGLLGLAVLCRASFVILPFMIFAVLALRRRFDLARYWRRAAVWMMVFAIPPSLWILRNYAVAGVFPLLSALEGETFYGGNNARVASDLSVWGYWIPPDQIPGESTKRELARRMTEAEVNRYYRAKGNEFVRTHIPELPRLIVGKLVRGFVPVPWTPSAVSYAASLFRIAIYALFIWAGRRWLRNETYAAMLGAVFLVTLATTIVYWGVFRFTWCFEIFLLPALAMGITERLVRRRRPAPAR